MDRATTTNRSTPAGRRRGCALVTGASRGIGAAIAEELAAAGWPVAVNWCTGEAGAAAVVQRIEARGGRAAAFGADVADAGAVDEMFDAAEQLLGPVLVLVNNAGTRHDRLVVALEEPDWDRVLAVNLTAAHRTMKRALGAMVSARFGRIVNISTISAAQPMPGQAAYAASKAGLEALTRTAAVETAHRGITVNAIAPGLVDTDFIADVPDDWARMLPPRRTARPGEIAACVGFLVSESAAYVNGATLRADGGLTAGIRIGARRSRPQAGDQRPSEEPHGHRITGAG